MKLRFATTQDADRSLLPPMRASEGAAGYDICANLNQTVNLRKGKTALIPTGLKISMEKGFEAQIRPRSGLAIKHGVSVVNAPGTIDWDYRGEIQVGLINLGELDFEITHGMRIAQIVFARVELPEFIEDSLDETTRGTGSFGSTGLLGEI